MRIVARNVQQPLAIEPHGGSSLKSEVWSLRKGPVLKARSF